MLGPHDLKPGVMFSLDGDPWVVLEATFVKMAQRTGHVEAKVKNLRTAHVLVRSFKQSDRFPEAEVERIRARFIYEHRGAWVFADADNPKQRFELNEAQVGDGKLYLTSGVSVDLLRFEGSIIGIQLPPKVDLRVTDAPPWVKGDTAQGGTKTVTTETGLMVRTPHFIETGAVIRVNTKTGEYVERVEK